MNLTQKIQQLEQALVSTESDEAKAWSEFKLQDAIITPLHNTWAEMNSRVEQIRHQLNALREIEAANDIHDQISKKFHERTNFHSKSRR